MDKLMYTLGNLAVTEPMEFSPWAVKAEQQFGSVDVFGPFSSENQANNFAHALVQDEEFEIRTDCPYRVVKVVRLETPQAGRQIVRRRSGEWSYAEVKNGVLKTNV